MRVTKSEEYLTNQKCYISEHGYKCPDPAFAKVTLAPGVQDYICYGHVPYALVGGFSYEILKKPSADLKAMWKANGLI